MAKMESPPRESESSLMVLFYFCWGSLRLLEFHRLTDLTLVFETLSAFPSGPRKILLVSVAYLPVTLLPQDCPTDTSN